MTLANLWSISGIGIEFIVTIDIIRDIYMGKITKWNDSRLTGMNPGKVIKNERISTVDGQVQSGVLVLKMVMMALSLLLGFAWAIDLKVTDATIRVIKVCGLDDHSIVLRRMLGVDFCNVTLPGRTIYTQVCKYIYC